jgi:hypothetical protein
MDDAGGRRQAQMDGRGHGEHTHAGDHRRQTGTAAYGRGRQRQEVIRVEIELAANGYDRWDPRFSVASDEPTVGKRKRRSNRRNSSAPG